MKYNDILKAQQRHKDLKGELAAVVNLRHETTLSSYRDMAHGNELSKVWSDMERGLSEEIARIRKEIDELEV